MPTKKKEKHIGQVFTPDFIVREMLDYTGYTAENDIIGKHVMENSCGDGAFLMQIVERYIQAGMKNGCSDKEICSGLETYIHGIDTDEAAIKNCLANLNGLAAKHNLHDVAWDIRLTDALSVSDYNGKMDYVIGNPPYVRVHNLDETYNEVKSFRFAEGGMTDLYLVFFEIGFRMLNETGRMCYITPSSWLHSVAATNMRSYIVQHENLISLVDLGHFQPFGNITTYTLISLFSKDTRSKEFDYYVFNGKTLTRDFITRLSYDDVLVDSCFYIAKRESLLTLKKVKAGNYRKCVSVKNGFATLADKSFIGNDIPDTFITIPIVKGSTGKWTKGLFPYDKNGKPLPKNLIFSDPILSEHFNKEKDNLLKGKTEYDGWHLYGRTQALGDVWKNKIAINTLVRTAADLKIEQVNEGEGIYSGLYIIGDIDIDTAKELLMTEEFIDYVKCIKKYKSGGYYTFNSKDVEQFLNYKLKSRNHHGQPTVSQCHFQFV